MFVGAVKFNPVLIQCVALCPVVAATQNLEDAFFTAVAIFADLIITAFIASTLLKKVPRFVRVALYLIIGLAIICPVLWLIEFRTLISLSLIMKIILPLVAVNSATAVHCETFAVKNEVRTAVNDAVAAGTGIGVIMLICGAIREIAGSGTILGRSLGLKVTLPGMAMPVGCLVILGFGAAALQKFFSEEKSPSARKDTEHQPEEVELGMDDDYGPELVDMDFAYENDDEYAYLLSSVNELIESFSSGDDDEEGES